MCGSMGLFGFIFLSTHWYKYACSSIMQNILLNICSLVRFLVPSCKEDYVVHWG